MLHYTTHMTELTEVLVQGSTNSLRGTFNLIWFGELSSKEHVGVFRI